MSATDGNHAPSHAEPHGHGAHGPPPPPEPETPMWLPAVGALLFLGAALLWAAGAKAPDTANPGANAASSAATGAAPSGAAGRPAIAPARALGAH